MSRVLLVLVRRPRQRQRRRRLMSAPARYIIPRIEMIDAMEKALPTTTTTTRHAFEMTAWRHFSCVFIHILPLFHTYTPDDGRSTTTIYLHVFHDTITITTFCLLLETTIQKHTQREKYTDERMIPPHVWRFCFCLCFFFFFAEGFILYLLGRCRCCRWENHG
jgi:hypothetical protein